MSTCRSASFMLLSSRNTLYLMALAVPWKAECAVRKNSVELRLVTTLSTTVPAGVFFCAAPCPCPRTAPARDCRSA